MAAAVTAALAGPALAATGAAACEVEEWRWKYQPAFERLSFKGGDGLGL